MSFGPDTAPLIVTAQMPPDIASWTTALRRRHFPPERNFLDAHVTLFHAIAPQCCDEVQALLSSLAGEYAPVAARIDRIVSLGRGTALTIESAGMMRLRKVVAERLHGLLTRQDQHHPRLHVTIQNKVDPAVARNLQALMQPDFQPRAFAFRGFALDRYRGGPWEPVREFAFRGKQQA